MIIHHYCLMFGMAINAITNMGFLHILYRYSVRYASLTHPTFLWLIIPTA
jgi:hypothetical protein